MLCPKAGPSLQAEKPRLQFCRRQVFHSKLRNQGCTFTRDLICAVASRCFPHPTLSLAFEKTLKYGCANYDTEGKRFNSPIHCCDATKPPYLFTGELCTSPLHCEFLFVYIVCYRCTGQCFSVLRTRNSDVILP